MPIKVICHSSHCCWMREMAIALFISWRSSFRQPDQPEHPYAEHHQTERTYPERTYPERNKPITFSNALLVAF
ncbi:MAG: hypothetical protein AB4042_06610 [Leptolyngbyaceae cyanobacterium]